MDSTVVVQNMHTWSPGVQPQRATRQSPHIKKPRMRGRLATAWMGLGL